MRRRTRPAEGIAGGTSAGPAAGLAGAPGPSVTAADDPFELNGYYLARPHPEHRGIVYACRYDPGAGRVRRRSLGTADWQEAKVELATLVLAKPAASGSTPGPDQVMTVTALSTYLDGHAMTIRSLPDAERAAELVKQYLDSHLKNPMLTVAAWTPARQLDFARWLHQTFKHKPTSIERRLDVLCAALQDMTKVKLRKDPIGQDVECALMTHAPAFIYKRRAIAHELKLPPPTPRHSTHTLETVGKVLDAIPHEHLFRYAILALTTWARPEAIADFDPAIQLADGLIDLNPPGRPQTNKHRPRIPLTRTLAFWLGEWQRADAEAASRAREAGNEPKDTALLVYNGERVKSVKKSLRKLMAELGIKKFTPGTFRHIMATTIRRLCRQVSREQRSLYLGHTVKDGSRTTDNYEAFDPDYLSDVSLAIDFVMQELQRHTKRRLVSVDDRLSRRDMQRIGARPSEPAPQLKAVAGGG